MQLCFFFLIRYKNVKQEGYEGRTYRVQNYEGEIVMAEGKHTLHFSADFSPINKL